MSLQVWLPLNKDINSRGLCNVPTTSINSASIVNGGKLGNCLSLSSDGQAVSLDSYMDVCSTYTRYSMSAWIYMSSTATNHSASILSSGNWNSKDSQFCFALYNYSSGGYYKILVPNNSAWSDGIDLSSPIKLSTWYNICITYDGSSTRGYVNGEYVGSYAGGYITPSSESRNLYVGSATYYNEFTLKGSMNDVRIYDHCLSAKEVKEISKGMIGHWKLDNGGFGSPNLFSNTHFDSRYTVTDWDTSKNGTLCASGWGGYNGGVGNPSTVYHAHLQEHEGDYVYNYHKTSNEGWLGISQVITSRVAVNKTYTFSCELKRVSGTNCADGGLYTKASSSASSNTFVNYFAFNSFSSVTDNAWHKYTYTFTIDSSVDMSSRASWYIYGHTGGDGEFLMRRPKLEEGLGSTEWAPHTSDPMYSALGLDLATESDSSGLSNNGTKIGGVSVTTSPQSIRYDNCYTFDGNTGSIQIPNLATMCPSGEFTMNCWIYHDDTWSSKTYETIFGGPGGFELEAKNSSTNSPVLRAYSWGGGTATYELDKWNMITMTRNASETKFYINGELKITGSAGTIPSGNYFIGAWNTSSQQNYKGQISDFRLYSTVLSVDDIKRLYDVSASIDKSGNIYAYEFKEE